VNSSASRDEVLSSSSIVGHGNVLKWERTIS
jgi:hypothetical protein